MAGTPDFPHATGTESRLEPVGTQKPGPGDVEADRVDHARAEVGENDGERRADRYPDELVDRERVLAHSVEHEQ